MMGEDRIGLDDVNSIPDRGILERGGADTVDHPNRYPHTDIGNADRFADQYGPIVRYCAPWRKWLVWDGQRWKLDDVLRVEEFANRTARSIVEAAKKLPAGTEGRDALMKHGIRSQGVGRVRSILELGRARPGIPVLPEELDDGKFLLNLANGTLDLQEMRLRDHNKLDLLTKVSPVVYDPEAECFRWTSFLNEVFCGDTDLIEFIQRAVGYSLTGDTSEQCFFILWGSGENGKSAFLAALRKLMGEYTKHAPEQTFNASQRQGIPNDVARLMGMRFVTAIETEEGKKIDETLVKQVTGGDPLTARFLHGEFFEFEAQFKVWLATNHRPNVKGTDHAIWRRIRLIPFNASFKDSPDREERHVLDAKLERELSGILNWALDGLKQLWLGHPLDEMPDAVRFATKEYREEEDVIGNWLNECCRLDETGRSRVQDLYDSYVAWAAASGERPVTKNKFSRGLTERGIDGARSNATNWKLGVELLGPLEQDAQA